MEQSQLEGTAVERMKLGYEHGRKAEPAVMQDDPAYMDGWKSGWECYRRAAEAAERQVQRSLFPNDSD